MGKKRALVNGDAKSIETCRLKRDAVENARRVFSSLDERGKEGKK